ncbi:unnamed protein product [Parnassius apollo]|uniref:(apollo) hypothetical protein n=1 Tax=Parnassius apollo TaxID=110799 RepID=A0A8S3XFT9_PARAO|nr:unnamed protein product [Parnassius apollo]
MIKSKTSVTLAAAAPWAWSPDGRWRMPGRVASARPTSRRPPTACRDSSTTSDSIPLRHKCLKCWCARGSVRGESRSYSPSGEFCVFAAELRRCSRQTRQASNKPDSPVRSVDKELRDKDTMCKHVNGSEASPPPCEVFLGGSCNPTTWRSDIAIPLLKKMGITYFNPQVEDWSTELMEVEHRAKCAARALLFVLDSETRAVAASVEAAHLAAAPRDLLLVLRPYARHQTIGGETISDQEYVELSRARATLQEAVERRGLPAFSDIPAALSCARAVLRGARTQPRHSLGHTILRLKRAFDAAGGRTATLSRARALEALREATRAPPHLAERVLPPDDHVDFETFCAAVAELATDADSQSRNGQEEVSRLAEADEKRVSADSGERPFEANGLLAHNPRLRAYGRKLGLFIPKNSGNRASEGVGRDDGRRDRRQRGRWGRGRGRADARHGAAAGAPARHAGRAHAPRVPWRRLPVFTEVTENELQYKYIHNSGGARAEEILRREGFTYVVPRANDYTRMFSAPARRAAPRAASPAGSPCDKRPRSAARTPPLSPDEEPVQLRERSTDAEVADRLSASDFYTVSEDVTPQPFKGTYDEELLLGSRVLVFSMSAEAPCFAAMVLAAHYMGLRPAATVLLVQPMDPAATHLHSYSEAAVKDYNRGRHYLLDLARRSKIPVFDNVEAAMACVVRRLRTDL